MTDAAVDEPLVLTEDIGPVRRLTMNRPKRAERACPTT